MIVKELEPITSGDTLVRAGRRAEEQMAFYLRRAFAETQTLRIFNDIRLEHEDDAAQIDHLILHRFGMIIIESKSVTSRVEINERGEWTRIWNGIPKGMASPVLQARRQADFLRRELSDNAATLRGKFLGLIQTRFGAMPIDVIVAISDEGVIKQPRKAVEDAVCKADQVSDRVRLIYERLKKENSLFNTNASGGYQLSEADVVRISDFLLARHRPIATGAGSPVSREFNSREQIVPQLPSEDLLPLPAAPPYPFITPNSVPLEMAFSLTSVRQTCRHCLGTSIMVEYGRYGYYFKCAGCGGNTPIKAICPDCSARARIRKNGAEFFTECGDCGKSNLFHANRLSEYSVSCL